MKISDLAISNFQFTIIIIVLLVIFGLSSFLNMPRSENPMVTPPGTSITVIYPGASPADMEQLVLDPIEAKMNEMTDIKRIISFCRDSLAVTTVEFDTGVDMDQTYSELVQKVNSIRSDLPEDIMELHIQRWVMSDFVVILQLALLSESAPYGQLEKEADRLEKMLEKIAGVKKAETSAFPEQEIRISLDLEKISQMRIPMNQVIASIQSSNTNIPGGNIDLGGKRFNIQTSGSYESLDEIKSTIVHASGEKVVFLEDIADVRFDYEDELYTARANGQRAVWVTVCQKENTNIFTVMEGIGEKLSAFKKELPSSITLYTVFDQSETVRSRLNSFFGNLLQGLVLVGIFVFIAVGLRASVIVMLAIPLSLLIGIGFIDLTGYGLQQMVIAGLVISLGLLVDNAIVVTENISRFLKMGRPPIHAAVEGTSQIGWAIVSATLTTVLAFLPIAMMGYTSGDYIRSMPLTVIYTLTASLFIALTFTPFLSSRFLKPKQNHEERKFRSFLLFLIKKTYKPTLSFALRHPIVVLSAVIAIFSFTLFMFQFVGVSFFPKAESAVLIINIDTPEGSNMKRTHEAALYVESVLKQKEDIKKIATNIGHGNPQVHYNIESQEINATHAQLYVELKEFDAKKIAGLISEMRQEFSGFPGARIEIKELEQGPPVEAPIAIKILGDNVDILRDIARDVEKVFLSVPGTVNVLNPQKFPKTDLHVRINRAKAGMLGIPIIDIDRTVRACIAGLSVSKFRDEEGKEFDIVVRLPFEGKPTIEDFDKIYITSITGAQIPLRQIADITFRTSPRQIDHYNFDRAVTITADVESGFTTNLVTRAIIDQLEEYSWPIGYEYYVAGEMESQQESFGGMGKAIIIALIAIFAVLVLQFKSFSQPMIVFAAIPLAVIGSIWALLITGNTFSFTAFIGLTSLVGIVVNNSILLVDYANQLRKSGRSISDALQEAGEIRFIPIVLTTGTTIGGLLPLTLQGGTLYGPMGWTIIGGLAVSTFLTLIVVPTLYGLFTSKTAVKPGQPIP